MPLPVPIGGTTRAMTTAARIWKHRQGLGRPSRVCRALVTPLATDTRCSSGILCNEPQSGAAWAKGKDAEHSKREHDWLAAVAQTVRRCGARQPLPSVRWSATTLRLCRHLRCLCGLPMPPTRQAWSDSSLGFHGLRQKFGKNRSSSTSVSRRRKNDREPRAPWPYIYCELLSRAGFGLDGLGSV